MAPKDSWVAKWEGINGLAPGIYAKNPKGIEMQDGYE
jgi:hypothetical protein